MRSKLDSISLIFLALFVLATGAVSISPAFAEPLDSVRTLVLNNDGNSATVVVAWHHDDSVKDYRIGCISCAPNVFHHTSNNAVIFDDVTPLLGMPLAMFYAIAYDSQGEIILAKQIIADLDAETGNPSDK